MGCDIHVFVERKVKDKWVMVKEIDGDARRRNYERFARLAGVCGIGPEPKGLPEDVSDSVKLISDDWRWDGHSHSWYDAKTAAQIWLETEMSTVSSYRKDDPQEWFFDIQRRQCTCCGQLTSGEHRIVFFFDN